MKYSGRGQTRKLSWKHAIRKKRISHNRLGGDYYDNLHQYSKNKIHCSCCMCRARNEFGVGKNSNAANSISDQRQLSSMQSKLNEI